MPREMLLTSRYFCFPNDHSSLLQGTFVFCRRARHSCGTLSLSLSLSHTHTHTHTHTQSEMAQIETLELSSRLSGFSSCDGVSGRLAGHFRGSEAAAPLRGEDNYLSSGTACRDAERANVVRTVSRSHVEGAHVSLPRNDRGASKNLSSALRQ